MDMNELIAQLRQGNQMNKPIQNSQGIPTGGGVIGAPSQFGGGGLMDVSQSSNQQQMNPTSSILDAAKLYNNASGGKLTSMFGLGTGGATGAAGSAAMPAMAAGGGSSLGSMGLISSAAPVSFPGATAAGGGGATAGGAGLAGAGGMLAGLGALAYLGDKEMNESEGSIINADKLNDMGSYKGIGFRAGDLVNGFNPATWVSDPKKAAKGLGNFFTLGFLDKLI